MKIVIVGSGIMGICSAFYLLQDGHDVTIIDKSDGLTNCSSGNLGMIVPSHFVPLSSPGIVAKGLKWLLDSKSPFYIRPSLDLNLAKWGLSFMRHANATHCAKSAKPLKDFNVHSGELYQAMQAETGLLFELEQKGIIMYFNTEKGGEEEMHGAKDAQTMGLDVSVLNKSEINQLEPKIDMDVLGGVYYKCDAHLNPNKLNLLLKNYLKSKGVKFLYQTETQKFESSGNRITGLVTNTGKLDCDNILVATGAWSKTEMEKLGLNLPMMPGKGYTFNVPNEPNFNIPSILCEARVAITPMGNTIRYGGTMEIGAFSNKVNMNRVEGIVAAANKYFKNVNVQIPKAADVWYGYRPCSPDGLPYLGKMNKYSNVVVATGHSMMGLSLGAATGKAVADIVSNKKTVTDTSIFDPNRFA